MFSFLLGLEFNFLNCYCPKLWENKLQVLSTPTFSLGVSLRICLIAAHMATKKTCKSIGTRCNRKSKAFTLCSPQRSCDANRWALSHFFHSYLVISLSFFRPSKKSTIDTNGSHYSRKYIHYTTLELRPNFLLSILRQLYRTTSSFRALFTMLFLKFSFGSKPPKYAIQGQNLQQLRFSLHCCRFAC